MGIISTMIMNARVCLFFTITFHRKVFDFKNDCISETLWGVTIANVSPLDSMPGSTSAILEQTQGCWWLLGILTKHPLETWKKKTCNKNYLLQEHQQQGFVHSCSVSHKNNLQNKYKFKWKILKICIWSDVCINSPVDLDSTFLRYSFLPGNHPVCTMKR